MIKQFYRSIFARLCELYEQNGYVMSRPEYDAFFALTMLFEANVMTIVGLVDALFSTQLVTWFAGAKVRAISVALIVVIAHYGVAREFGALPSRLFAADRSRSALRYYVIGTAASIAGLCIALYVRHLIS
jgi:hypothetical protein